MKVQHLGSIALALLTIQSFAAPNTMQAVQAPKETPAPAANPPVAQAVQNKPVNCDFHLAANTTDISATLVADWAKMAAGRCFDFDYEKLDEQLAALKSCFTERGWQSFNEALQKSGNINAIRSEKLHVNAMPEGKEQVTTVDTNQWKVEFPISVVYQNEQEKITQNLKMMMTIGRKPNGDFGIVQLIASPEKTQAPTQPESAE